MARGSTATSVARLTVVTTSTGLHTFRLTKDGSNTIPGELKSETQTLDAEQRQSVENAIRETCLYRRWHLHALNVRTNHVHVVVSTGTMKAGRALNALKANAARQMRRPELEQSA
jgi:hypothetical protein